jgi:hypothetical protein
VSGGRWVQDDARWFELRMRYCDLCGRVIPKHLWQVEIGGTTRTFCNADCEDLYREYVLGASAAA